MTDDIKPSDEAMAFCNRIQRIIENLGHGDSSGAEAGYDAVLAEIDAFATERVNREVERRREAEAKLTWRPIETAPRNESVLIFIPNCEHYGHGVYRGMLVDMGT